MGTHHAHPDHHQGHHHAPANYDRAFIIGLILNLGFVLIEFVFGLLAHSISLIADAGHNLSDVLGLVMAWAAVLVSRRQPSHRRTYGWRRASILAALFNAVFLLVVTGGIAWEAVNRFYSPDAVAGNTIIVVAAIGIVINSVTAWMFMSGRQSDINIRAAYLHMAADALVSFGVVLAGVAIWVTQWNWLDPAFSLVISAIIIWNTGALLKEAFNLAIDAVPERIDFLAVRTFLAERPGVQEVHDLHIWGISTTEVALTAHLIMPDGHPGDQFLAELGHELHDHFDIDHVTLQIELGDTDHACHSGCPSPVLP